MLVLGEVTQKGIENFPQLPMKMLKTICLAQEYINFY